MSSSQKTNTDDLKQANSKQIKVGGETKTLLLDDEEEKNKLKKYIEEYITKSIKEIFEQQNSHIEESGQTAFKIEDFKKIPNLKNKIKYAEMHLGKSIGKGTARIVFPLNKDTVIKIALNENGLLQNAAEISIFRKNNSNLISQIKNFDKDFSYIETEKATPATPNDWKKNTGISFRDWAVTLKNHLIDMSRANANKELAPENYEDIEETKFFKDTVKFILKNSVMAGDLLNLSSWGIASRNGKMMPVIIDYGLTKSNANNVAQ
jgi:hypothetical protein